MIPSLSKRKITKTANSRQIHKEMSSIPTTTTTSHWQSSVSSWADKYKPQSIEQMCYPVVPTKFVIDPLFDPSNPKHPKCTSLDLLGSGNHNGVFSCESAAIPRLSTTRAIVRNPFMRMYPLSLETPNLARQGRNVSINSKFEAIDSYC